MKRGIKMNYYVKEQIRILSHQSIVSNQNYNKVLTALQERYIKYPVIILQQAFNFGKIIQKRNDRDLKKWNKLACFHNMKAYAEQHNGKLPKTYNDLMKWVNHIDEVGVCHE